MRIVITGGFGFLGRQVAQALLEQRTFDGAPSPASYSPTSSYRRTRRWPPTRSWTWSRAR